MYTEQDERDIMRNARTIVAQRMGRIIAHSRKGRNNAARSARLAHMRVKLVRSLHNVQLNAVGQK